MSLTQEIHLLRQRPRIHFLTATGNWNSGVATSGLAGADLYTWGTPGKWWRLTLSCFHLAVFNIAADVTIRGYETFMGGVRLIFTDEWTVALDGEIAWINWFFDTQIYGQVRIEVYSDQAADDGLVVPYEVWDKDW